ncbi:hypothetical protein E2C01_002638 [Portunus trituberculatus]|uniref:Uncharacterized protein n=1 Tax=Portunus trituberculatus TaxID=210409 RepID=A0A5B7CMP7_PORTR|nr:hypothetical protein [Portunus trituberculatus]
MNSYTAISSGDSMGDSPNMLTSLISPNKEDPGVSNYRRRPIPRPSGSRADSWRPLEYCIAPQHAGSPPARPAPPRSLSATGNYAGCPRLPREKPGRVGQAVAALLDE